MVHVDKKKQFPRHSDGKCDFESRGELTDRVAPKLWKAKTNILLNIKFYKIYQTQVWVALKKILMLTTNFYFEIINSDQRG